MPDKKPWWLAIAVITIGGLWIYGASHLDQGATYAKVGPGMFVTLIGLALIAFGLLLGFQIFAGERFEAQEAEGADASQPIHREGFWLSLVGISLPLLLMQRVGFVLTAAACFVVIAAAFGERRWLRSTAIGLILAALAWFMFSRIGVTLGPFVTFKI